MRLWHKDLIPYLPRQQLLGQWRECCAIARNIKEKGTPNHVLVNKVLDYPVRHFWSYGRRIHDELKKEDTCATGNGFQYGSCISQMKI